MQHHNIDFLTAINKKLFRVKLLQIVNIGFRDFLDMLKPSLQIHVQFIKDTMWFVIIVENILTYFTKSRKNIEEKNEVLSLTSNNMASNYGRFDNPLIQESQDG